MSEKLNLQNNGKRIFSINSTEILELYSEVEIKATFATEEYIVYKDFLIEALRTLKTVLIKAVELKLQVPSKYLEKGMGFIWNEYCCKLNLGDEDIDDLTSQYHLWSTESTNGVETWIFNKDEKIIVEITPTFNWYEQEGESIEQDYLKFINNYKNITCFELSKESALEWIKICDELLNK